MKLPLSSIAVIWLIPALKLLGIKCHEIGPQNPLRSYGNIETNGGHTGSYAPQYVVHPTPHLGQIEPQSQIISFPPPSLGNVEPRIVSQWSISQDGVHFPTVAPETYYYSPVYGSSSSYSSSPNLVEQRILESTQLQNSEPWTMASGGILATGETAGKTVKQTLSNAKNYRATSYNDYGADPAFQSSFNGQMVSGLGKIPLQEHTLWGPQQLSAYIDPREREGFQFSGSQNRLQMPAMVSKTYTSPAVLGSVSTYVPSPVRINEEMQRTQYNTAGSLKVTSSDELGTGQPAFKIGVPAISNMENPAHYHIISDSQNLQQTRQNPIQPQISIISHSVPSFTGDPNSMSYHIHQNPTRNEEFYSTRSAPVHFTHTVQPAVSYGAMSFTGDPITGYGNAEIENRPQEQGAFLVNKYVSGPGDINENLRFASGNRMPVAYDQLANVKLGGNFDGSGLNRFESGWVEGDQGTVSIDSKNFPPFDPTRAGLISTYITAPKMEWIGKKSGTTAVGSKPNPNEELGPLSVQFKNDAQPMMSNSAQMIRIDPVDASSYRNIAMQSRSAELEKLPRQMATNVDGRNELGGRSIDGLSGAGGKSVDKLNTGKAAPSNSSGFTDRSESSGNGGLTKPQAVCATADCSHMGKRKKKIDVSLQFVPTSASHP